MRAIGLASVHLVAPWRRLRAPGRRALGLHNAGETPATAPRRAF